MFLFPCSSKMKSTIGFIVVILFPFILIGQNIDPHCAISNESDEVNRIQRLEELEKQVQKDLLKINCPRKSWIINSIQRENEAVLDVAIVGGGMAGMTASFALIKEGICNIKIFDENSKDHEGPWIKCARMNALRSGKRFMGPALGIPSLTVWSWYEAQYGKDAWDNLSVCPTKLWHDYLCWYRRVLRLPVENQMTLVKLRPMKDLLELTFDHQGYSTIVYARKVVLATGIEGSGALKVPHFLNGVAKHFYAHTGESINPQFFHHKRVVIVGAGSSAFDAAGVALENGAQSVKMLVRRSSVSQINKVSQLCYPGFENGFYFLPDEMRCQFFAEAFKDGSIDPSKAAVERIKDFDNLHVHYNTLVQRVIESDHSVVVQTNRGIFKTDFIIVATGYDVDLSKRTELDEIRSSILFWENRAPREFLEQVPLLGRFPYLGPHFEFMELEDGQAPFLKNIYCFNYGALLSHSTLSSDIPSISLGATRLAKGIATDFFLSDSLLYFEKFINSHYPDFNPNDYPPLSPRNEKN